ncbi:MAG: hypothetical protein EOM80_17345 [Erysipelotrichia bacterium]|nr:hypothetical protein [Erysipelotrichia bacterium]
MKIKSFVFMALMIVLSLKPAIGESVDPFADLDGLVASATLNLGSGQKAGGSSFFKNEIMTQFSFSSGDNGADEVYHRHSYGFEFLKKFANEVSTTSSFNLQARLVFRRQFVPLVSDMEGEERPELFFEYHNLYFDFYNALDSWLAPEARARNLGRFNFRLGRFYLPFGLNLQTDTHGTILQLTNDRNFGFERDWYAGFWGALDKNLNYDLYYMLGSGYEIAARGQSGLIGARVSLSNRFLYDQGLEAGLAIITGERLSKHALMRSRSVMANAGSRQIVDTMRVGLDGRYGQAVKGGKMTLTTEVSTGKDETDDVFTQLYQLDFLRRDRKFGWATQYRRFWQEITHNETDASLIGELTWYFNNDVGNTNLEWIKLNIEKKLAAQNGNEETITSLQYYRYW